jgi:hypothetical protein
MPKLTASSGIDIDDGTYEATLLEITLEDPTDNSPKQEQWLKWIFQVYNGSEDGVEMAVGSSQKFGTKAKARGWVEAILARKLAPGEEFDTDTFCPKDCQVTLKKDLESGFTKIIDVMAPRRRPQPARPAASSTKTPPRPRPAPAAAAADAGVPVDDDDLPF